MLEVVRIKNFAIIEEAEIVFGKGLNIISGETGAGKSILIDAISLILGGRATTDLIRTGSEDAVVEGLFDLSESPWMKERLEVLGFSNQEDELLIKRVLSRNGKHKIHINGELSTLNLLHDLCEDLVDLCGQHEHQSLMKSSVQLAIIDRFGDLTDVASDVSHQLGKCRILRQDIATLEASRGDQMKRSDFIQFQIQEIRAAQLKPGEDIALMNEKQLLQSTSQRAEGFHSIERVLDSEEEAGGIMESLRIALAKARTIAKLDTGSGKPIVEGLERAFAETEEVLVQVRGALNRVDSDPNRLETVQERLSMIAEFKRKYGENLDDVLAHVQVLEDEYSKAKNIDARIESMTSELIKLESALFSAGVTLSKARILAAKKLAKLVSEELQDLKMDQAVLEIDFDSMTKDLAQVAEWSPQSGPDTVQFQIRTNKGEALKPLQRIASGGELSRVTLAIRRVIGDRGRIGVFLFDEIDAGMGGQTAFQVGRKLKAVSAGNQVICITHLAQVASFGDHHLNVCKIQRAGRTITQVVPLDKEGSRDEIARMLGGEKITPTSLKNASDLIAEARGSVPKKKALKRGEHSKEQSP